MRSWPAAICPELPGRGLPVRLRDTATGEVRPLAPGRLVRLYVCGITPYDAAHLGHAATYVAFDTLVRMLRDGGHDVRYVQNVTDVDDPLLERAQATGEDWRELATREIERFRQDMTALGVLPPTDFVGAVEAMGVITALVDRLAGVGAAYPVEDDLYFPLSAAPRFGEVAGLDRAGMLALSAQRGGDPTRPGKKDPLDALLWRAQRPGEPAWESPFGLGRPGWHVECAAIALDRLGATVDVQGGGADLAFPHHEYSTAHALAATGHWPFARFHVHTGMVGFAGEKMSKSRGNLVFVSRLIEAGVDPAAIRLTLLAEHYRTAWPYTPDRLVTAGERLARWRRAVARPAGPPAAPVREQVRARLADDLDTPGALAVVDRWCAAANAGGHGEPGAGRAVQLVVDALLGVDLLGPGRRG